jgi:hypothetical protein
MSHLVVVGAQRCGTTYLADLLGAHPQVALAEPRRPEPKAFLDDAVVERGRQWYVQTYFAHAAPDRVLAEKSTSYLDHPESAGRMRTVLGDVRTLAQLRDPVSRAVSHWRFSSAHGVEDRPLEQALEESLQQEADWDPGRYSFSPFAYLSRGDYASALQPWVACFGDRLRIQLLEDLTREQSVAEMFAWLGLPPSVDVPRPPVNRSEGEQPVLSDDLHARLRAYFAPSDEALRDLPGRRLPWDQDERSA